eukprot:s1280_g10.t3
MTDAPESSDSVVSFESLPGHYRLPCNLCLFYTSLAGCRRGDACAFCHHTVPAPSQAGLSVTRPNSKRRRNIKRTIESLLQQLSVEEQTPQEVVDQLQKEAQRSEYIRWVCQCALENSMRNLAHRLRARGCAVQHRPERLPDGSDGSDGSDGRDGSCKALHCFALHFRKAPKELFDVLLERFRSLLADQVVSDEDLFMATEQRDGRHWETGINFSRGWTA